MIWRFWIIFVFVDCSGYLYVEESIWISLSCWRCCVFSSGSIDCVSCIVWRIYLWAFLLVLKLQRWWKSSSGLIAACAALLLLLGRGARVCQKWAVPLGHIFRYYWGFMLYIDIFISGKLILRAACRSWNHRWMSGVCIVSSRLISIHGWSIKQYFQYMCGRLIPG